MAKKSSGYDAESIVVLEGLEPVRKRPGMYIGSTSQVGVNHCLNEIVDNAIDEALAGYCHNIHVRIEKNDYLTVFDDGRGIPVEKNPKHKTSALELVMTKLHAGGKFTTSAYKVSGGLHGVGASVVNALAEHLIVEVRRDGQLYRQEYKRGKALYPVKKVSDSILKFPFKNGTAISFLPDKEIFKETIEINYGNFKKQVKERAYLISSTLFKIVNVKTSDRTAYFFDGGILSLIRDINRGKKVIHEAIYIKKALTGDDVKEGLSAIVYVKMSSTNLQFEGQTKSKLGNSEVQTFVQQAVSEYLDVFFEENPRVGRDILGKIILAQRARLAAKAA